MEYQMTDDETVISAVLHAVSASEDCPLESLPPLQETVPAEVLHKLFQEQFESSPTLSFKYSNSYVKIHDEKISVSSEIPGKRG